MLTRSQTLEEQPLPRLFRPPAPRITPWTGHRHLLREDEPVVITELIEGVEIRLACVEGFLRRLTSGGRDLVVDVLEQNPWVEEFCTDNPDHVLYGVVYEEARYGRSGVAIHDILRPDGKWTRWSEIDRRGPFADARRWVPVLYLGPYEDEEVRRFLAGRSTLPEATGPRAGVVIGPLRGDARGRLQVLAGEL